MLSRFVLITVLAVVCGIAIAAATEGSEAATVEPAAAAEEAWHPPAVAPDPDTGRLDAAKVGPELFFDCSDIEFFAQLAVVLMVAGLEHEAFIALGIAATLHMICNELQRALSEPAGNGDVPVRIEATDNNKFVPVEGLLNPATGEFHGEGVGTVAGFQNVTVEMDMTLQLNGDFEATYTMGANGELPGGNPGVYQITGTFDTSGADTPTPSPSPSPTEAPQGLETVWGNNNCSGADHKAQPDPVDSLFVLRGDAGLSADTGVCPGMGASVVVTPAVARQVAGPIQVTWGDVDCQNGMNPVDSLKILRFDAGLDAAQAQGCPDLGSEVTIAEDDG